MYTTAVCTDLALARKIHIAEALSHHHELPAAAARADRRAPASAHRARWWRWRWPTPAPVATPSVP